LWWCGGSRGHERETRITSLEGEDEDRVRLIGLKTKNVLASCQELHKPETARKQRETRSACVTAPTSHTPDRKLSDGEQQKEKRNQTPVTTRFSGGGRSKPLTIWKLPRNGKEDEGGRHAALAALVARTHRVSTKGLSGISAEAGTCNKCNCFVCVYALLLFSGWQL